MYRVDSKGGNQPQTWRPHSLVGRNVISLPMAGNNPRELRGSVALAPRSKPGACCSSCASGSPCSGSHKHGAAGLGDLTVGSFDLSTLGWAGYAALGLSLWMVSKVMFTGGRAKERRAAVRKLDADYRIQRDEIAKKYPRI